MFENVLILRHQARSENLDKIFINLQCKPNSEYNVQFYKFNNLENQEQKKDKKFGEIVNYQLGVKVKGILTQIRT